MISFRGFPSNPNAIGKLNDAQVRFRSVADKGMKKGMEELKRRMLQRAGVRRYFPHAWPGGYAPLCPQAAHLSQFVAVQRGGCEGTAENPDEFRTLCSSIASVGLESDWLMGPECQETLSSKDCAHRFERRRCSTGTSSPPSRVPPAQAWCREGWHSRPSGRNLVLSGRKEAS